MEGLPEMIVFFFDPGLVLMEGSLISRGFTTSLLSLRQRLFDWDNAANAQFSSANSTIAYTPYKNSTRT